MKILADNMGCVWVATPSLYALSTCKNCEYKEKCLISGVNSLWLSDAIWQHRSKSTLAQKWLVVYCTNPLLKPTVSFHQRSLSVTPFSQCSSNHIITKFSGVITIHKTDAHATDQATLDCHKHLYKVWKNIFFQTVQQYKRYRCATM